MNDLKGQRSVIWGTQMAQVELAEALHCGLMGLDHEYDNRKVSEQETMTQESRCIETDLAVIGSGLAGVAACFFPQSGYKNRPDRQ